jgi:hypothetical protein
MKGEEEGCAVLGLGARWCRIVCERYFVMVMLRVSWML